VSGTERLAYHQEKSAPVFEALHEWIEQQVSERRVEPNSSLGGALKYLLKHWRGLTQATRVVGAPLDNNLVERALKMAGCIARTRCSTRRSTGRIAAI
jgi:transposase